jgi:SAM-dependent methyltransferase
MTVSADHNCRHCNEKLDLVLADLGSTPISNDFLRPESVLGGEPYYPLRVFVCRNCRLAQLQDFFKSADLFREDYTYFSSFSSSWLEHSKRYAEQMSKRFNLDSSSQVVEIASNDGYLLQYFKEAGLNVLGIEPSQSVADVAIKERNIPTEVMFFGEETARILVDRGITADLMAANNVFAHVPNITDFAKGFSILLKPRGVATFEFPHLLNLIQLNQFDTIYHEHFSYLSLLAAESIFKAANLRVFDVERLPTHGGSLRLFVCHLDDPRDEEPGLKEVRDLERNAGMDDDALYLNFAENVRETKRKLLDVLSGLKRQGKTIVGYGAPAKGNTLLNYCGVGRDFLEFTTDRSPHKQGLYLPGTRIEVKAPEAIEEFKPDYVLILPWNLKDEVMEQMKVIRSWGGKFIVPIPTATIID